MTIPSDAFSEEFYPFLREHCSQIALAADNEGLFFVFKTPLDPVRVKLFVNFFMKTFSDPSEGLSLFVRGDGSSSYGESRLNFTVHDGRKPKHPTTKSYRRLPDVIVTEWGAGAVWKKLEETYKEYWEGKEKKVVSLGTRLFNHAPHQRRTLSGAGFFPTEPRGHRQSRVFVCDRS